MTRAQQSISFFFLLVSVCPTGPNRKALEYSMANRSVPQVYMAAFLHIIPLDKTIQDQIVPVVYEILATCFFLTSIPYWAFS